MTNSRSNTIKYPALLALLIAIFIVSCSPAAKEIRPNILFIMSDDHAYQAISAYGSGLNKTPNIDKIGEHGIIYERAFVTNSICAPSRAVILTGKYSHLNGVTGNSQAFDGAQQTLPKILQQNGYETAIIGKWHLKSAPTGFDYWNVLPGQGDYYNPDFIKQGKDTTYRGYVTEIITQLTSDWLSKRDQSKPFFLMMHHKAVHRSWMPAIKNLDLYNDREFELPTNFFDDFEGKEGLQNGHCLTIENNTDISMDFKVPPPTEEPNGNWFHDEYWRRVSRMSPGERARWDEAYKQEAEAYEQVKNDPDRLIRWKFQRYQEDYLRCVQSVDESVSEVLNFLKENQLDQNTIVIYTSDQGFFMGEHGFFDKRLMYEEAMRTPLLIQYPGKIEAGTRSDKMVLNLDIAPTLLRAAGIKVPADMQGQPMQATWNDSAKEWRDAIYYHYFEQDFGWSPHYGVRTERYKLIRYYHNVEAGEMFDLANDPTEMINLYNNPGYADLQKSLEQKLAELQEKYLDTNIE